MWLFVRVGREWSGIVVTGRVRYMRMARGATVRMSVVGRVVMRRVVGTMTVGRQMAGMTFGTG